MTITEQTSVQEVKEKTMKFFSLMNEKGTKRKDEDKHMMVKKLVINKSDNSFRYFLDKVNK